MQVKKLGIVLACLFLMGCQMSNNNHDQKQGETSIEKSDWLGRYKMGDIVLEITQVDEKGLNLTVQRFEKGFGGYAYFLTDDQAVYEGGEDGHTLHLTLHNDSITVEESGGITYLGVELSGEYER